MKFTLIILMVLSSMMTYANLKKAPKNFNIKNEQFVFADFKVAEYSIVYDFTNKKSIVRTRIIFEIDAQGKPVFDLKPKVLQAKLNGKMIKTKVIPSPQNVTTYNALDVKLAPGTYTLEIKNEIKNNVAYGGWMQSNQVASAFWMSDLTDRMYLEQYVPTNLEYDQMKMSMDVEVIGLKTDHEVFTNGMLSQKEKNKFHIEFPNYFTASSVYFHLAKKDRFHKVQFSYSSNFSQNIPVIAYSNNASELTDIEEAIRSILKELEGKFGQWSHPSLTVYMAGRGGMEHAGATRTSRHALAHEITHSFFARGVMPVDGNSGWMDEAIASWRDGGYKSVAKPNFNATRMSAHSQYQRTTDRKAYTEGANFMAFLNNRLAKKGGLKNFLKELHTNFTHANIVTEEFRNEIEKFSGINFATEFDQYIYNQKAGKGSLKNAAVNPYHPQLSNKELVDML